MNAKCLHEGHCWHEEEGAVYQRHSQRPVGTVGVHCCRCNTGVELPTHGKATQAGVLIEMEHGAFQ